MRFFTIVNALLSARRIFSFHETLLTTANRIVQASAARVRAHTSRCRSTIVKVLLSCARLCKAARATTLDLRDAST